MIETTCVSFEAAKLLKKRGFDCECKSYYNESGIKKNTSPIGSNYNYFKSYFSAPSNCLAQQWLREEKNIHIMIDVCASGYYAVLWETNGTFIKTLEDNGPNNGGVWSTYEEALEAGLLCAVKTM